MATPYRDRTAEFRSVTETLKRIGGITPPQPQPPTTSGDQQPPPPPQPQPQPQPQSNHLKNPSSTKLPSSSGSEFNKRASRIGQGVHETSQKISRLAQLAKRSSMFDDPIVEIQELTAVIKTDITSLNAALSDLQTLQNIEMAGGNYSDDRAVHSNAVCDDLKSKLMGVTKRLQEVLTTRTENIKAHENRKQIFSANRENPFIRQQQVTEPPPWANTASAFGSSQQEPALPQNGVQVGNQLRRRPGAENTPSQHMEMSMLQQVDPRQENYTQSRAVALHNVESTISELSGIFTNLATMVAQQGELAIRIDDNMDESLSNVENARSSLLKHLNQISSNRWLMIKIFAIIVLFLIVFIFFVA